MAKARLGARSFHTRLAGIDLPGVEVEDGRAGIDAVEPADGGLEDGVGQEAEESAAPEETAEENPRLAASLVESVDRQFLRLCIHKSRP